MAEKYFKSILWASDLKKNKATLDWIWDHAIQLEIMILTAKNRRLQDKIQINQDRISFLTAELEEYEE